MEVLILVNDSDTEIGSEEKLAAHSNGGRLHRAFSVFVYNSAGGMLLQKRAACKYHFKNLWTNACCGHPVKGEEVTDAARRRVKEELGIDVELRRAGTFLYRAEDVQSGLVEHEFDHMFVADFDGCLDVDPNEVAATMWLDPREVREWVNREPHLFTPWFPLAIDKLL